MQSLIDDHRKDIQSKFCNSCWKAEASGVESKRQQYNKHYSQYLDAMERSVKLRIVPVGNVCNLNCVTCDPAWSTGWIKKHNFMWQSNWNRSQIKQTVNDAHINDIESTSHVEFIGGETLLSRSFWQKLEFLDKNTSFSIQTNGTVGLSAQQVDLLRSFKKINICFSVDGYGEIFDYMRQPAKWPSTNTNIKKYYEHFGGSRLSFYLTVSNLNIFYIDKIMLELFKLIPVTISINLVSDPWDFSYDNVTPRVGQIIEKNNPVFFSKRSINWKGDEKTVSNTLRNLQLQDEFSGLKFADHLSDVYKIMSDDIRHNVSTRSIPERNR